MMAWVMHALPLAPGSLSLGREKGGGGGLALALLVQRESGAEAIIYRLLNHTFVHTSKMGSFKKYYRVCLTHCYISGLALSQAFCCF